MQRPFALVYLLLVWFAVAPLAGCGSKHSASPQNDAQIGVDADGADSAVPDTSNALDQQPPLDIALPDTSEPFDVTTGDLSELDGTSDDTDASPPSDAAPDSTTADLATIDTSFSEDANLEDQSSPDVGPDTADVDPTTPGLRLTFADEFNGPTSVDDAACYDNAKTKPMCLNRYWSREDCPASTLENLKLLNKCVWSVYNIYNWMDWGKPWGYGFTALDPHEVKVAGGELVLTSRWVTASGNSYDCGNDLGNYLLSKNCQIRTGAIMSRMWDDAQKTPGFQQTYGRFEVRAILPAGPGSWPAHWLLPQEGSWPEAGEIDIMEAIWEKPSDVHGSFHGGTNESGVRTHFSRGHHHDPGDSRFTSGWHVYAVEWDAGGIRFLVDDLEIGWLRQGELLEATVIESPDPNQVDTVLGMRPVGIPAIAFFWILNTSVVPTGGLKKDFSNFQTLTHRIDYVRVYERCLAAEPGCELHPLPSRNITNDPWMSASKWSTQYRVTHVGDFDGDGRQDLLLQSKGPGHATYLLLAAKTAMSFEPDRDLNDESQMTQDKWSAAKRRLIVADLNGDGADDVLLQGLTANDATYLLIADKKGGFLPPVDVSTSGGMSRADWAASTHRVLVGNFLSSTAPNLLVVGTDGKTYFLRYNKSTGFDQRAEWTTQFGMSAPTWATAYRVPIVGDFNGDGQSDIFFQPLTQNDDAFLLLSTPTGYADVLLVTDKYWMSKAKWSAEFRVAHVGDFNGDGRSDLLLQGRSSGHSTYLLLAQSSGEFDHELTQDSLAGMVPANWLDSGYRLLVVDANGDRRSDLLFQPRNGNGRVRLLLGKADGSFADALDITNESTLALPFWLATTREATVLDVDGDGKSEILLQNKNDSDPVYLLNLRR